MVTLRGHTYHETWIDYTSKGPAYTHHTSLPFTESGQCQMLKYCNFYERSKSRGGSKDQLSQPGTQYPRRTMVEQWWSERYVLKKALCDRYLGVLPAVDLPETLPVHVVSRNSRLKNAAVKCHRHFSQRTNRLFVVSSLKAFPYLWSSGSGETFTPPPLW